MEQAIVLLVDDEVDLLTALSNTLTRAGFNVCTAMDGVDALERFSQSPPDIVVLDLMLPQKDGLQVCQELRRISDVPIIMLTARDDRIDKILGLEMGADDYITKPFDSRELIARIRAILRRVKRVYAGTTVAWDGGRIEINLEGRNIRVSGQNVDLTATEYDLLAHLMQRPGRVFTRPELLEQVWDYDFPGDLRTVDVHIHRLRQKIEKDPANPRLILTKFGVGYVLVRN